MQLRFVTGLSAEEYVRQEAWKQARLAACPLHPEGGCRIAKHGSYSRRYPDGAKVPRWYCPDGHQSISLLPDCLSARLPGTLQEVEDVVFHLERSPSQDLAAETIRIDIEHNGVLRWMRRRALLIGIGLTMLMELMPSLSSCKPTIASFRERLGMEHVLVELRSLAGGYLQILPYPLGFAAYDKAELKKRYQHKTGSDPPRKTG